jgi:hypothetical protein
VDTASQKRKKPKKAHRGLSGVGWLSLVAFIFRRLPIMRQRIGSKFDWREIFNK